ncbi:SusC/RagA family TonB-linked outer membrane protein [Arachidicoccus ginsenosidimutans]|nr:SusC/RagA family TonB-linked outer membrane protein [Arachidicoccus sp. BS20]ANI90578.1 SusC/RagA family TonB-linked outer membrane protein [Arachidicoccus sp. BS20]
MIKGTKQGTFTDQNGVFKLDISSDTATLIFTYVGYQPVEIFSKKGNPIDIVLSPLKDSTSDVVVVAYGRQKKESMVASITTLNPKELRGATSNMTQMLAGRIAGIISFQQSGAPGADNASFFVRGVGSFGAGKVDPLILIDGVESTNDDLARLQPDDISGFSVLKDAAASSLYGARGANGVILVTTKNGIEGKTKFNVRAEMPVSSNTRNFKFADNVTYMNLANEAVLTRDPLGNLPYSQDKIDHTAAGDDPIKYPNNNWINQLIKDYTVNQKLNINASGGGKVAQYYLSGTYNVDNGVLKQLSGSDFNNNIRFGNYNVRSNVTINATPTTKITVRTYAQFDQYTGPRGYVDGNNNYVNGGQAVFNSAMWSNPVMFPAYYPGSYAPDITHPLFGNAFIPNTTSLYSNPFANMVSGYDRYTASTINVQLEFNQNLKFITEGLSTNFMAYTQRYNYFILTRNYNPFYYTLSPDANGNLNVLTLLNPGQGTEYLNYSEGPKIVQSTTYAQWAVNYNRTFNKKHAVTGMLIGILQNRLTGNAGDLQSSLPARNLGVSGRFTYAYDDRYLTEFDFGYNGSEKFADNHRFGFFPSIGAGWRISNESFFKSLKKIVTNLKLRATYGLVGNDQIGRNQDRFFYLSNVNANDDGRGYHWGLDQSHYVSGYSISRYANNNITWEKSKTLNYGFDLTFINKINVTVDAYHSLRYDILMQRTTIPSTTGLEAPAFANVGKATSDGVDIAVDFNQNFSNDMWIQARANMTYATNKYKKYEEPNYPDNEKYLSKVGNSINQIYGLLAERLFVDDNEARNSPVQSFGGNPPLGGDIKYRDINGDGQITNLDMIPIGYPTVPEITYGFGFSFGYKSFDINAFFQGNARTSFLINADNVSPFVLNGGSQNGLLSVIANDHWSENNQNLHAFWPRLDDQFNQNNDQSSTWWLENGSFLRFKTLEIGYTLPKKLLNKLHFSNFRIYVNGQNLGVISKFKLWDPEMGGNGLGYPLQVLYNLGINFGF